MVMRKSEERPAFWVGIADEYEGGWPHYCVQGEKVQLRVSHPGLTEHVYCPRCGALVPHDWPRHRDSGPKYFTKADYKGEKCVHGWPAATCLELVADQPDLDIEYSESVPEYAAALLARRCGVAPAVQKWARPCVQCRNEFARVNLPRLAFELAKLNEPLQQESVSARDSVRSLALKLHSVRVIQETLREVEARSRESPEPALGFVYAIASATAIKIGWSAKHPEQGRLQALQTSSHLPLKLIGAFLGTRGDEQELHARFAQHRIRGEWFGFVSENSPILRQS